ncbi:MAG: FHA domain-containing protein [Caldilineaceae bacterium]
MTKSGLYRIEVKSHANGSVQMVTCTKSSMTVGSDAFNDLILNGPFIQPQHLRIDFYGSQVRIVYGTSSRNTRLRPDDGGKDIFSAIIWKPGETHDVGNNYTLKLLSPKMVARPLESEPRWFGKYIYGLPLSQYSRFANPISGFVRMRWLLGIVASGTLLFFVGWLYGSSVLSGPISLPSSTARPESTNTVTPTPVQKEPSTSSAIKDEILKPTPKPIVTEVLPYWTPTRLPIQLAPDISNEDIVNGPDSTLIGNLVDGPRTVLPDAVMVLVTATPTLMPTATVAPVEIIELSPVLKQLGVWIEPAIVAVGVTYWRLEEARWLNEDESLGRNMIFVEIVDTAGHRMNREWVHIFWEDGSTTLMPNKSATDAYALDFLMNASGNAYSVQLKSMPSDTIHGLGMGTVEKRMTYSKTAFWLKFQQTVRQ